MWNLVGRVHFNLAENRHDAEAPFAFLATYTTRLSAQAKAQHLPLGRALTEYAGAANKARLLSLLLPVQRAAEQCPWLRAMVDSGEIYHPLRWTPAEAVQLLTDLPRLEAAGVVVRVPNHWRANRPPRPQVTAVVGVRPPSGVGTDALLDFRMDVTLDGERLTAAEIEKLLAATEGLQLVRGRWVEVDRDSLGRMLDEFRAVERMASEHGLRFAEAMRLLTGARVSKEEDVQAAAPDWSRVVAGPWLAKILEDLRRPGVLAHVDPGDALKAVLRPYQQIGVRWLHLLSSLGLCACLADDMGLGKTNAGAGAASGTRQAYLRFRDGDSSDGRWWLEASEPAGGAGVAPCELAVGSGAVRPGPAHAGRASLGDVERGFEGDRCEPAR